VQGQLGTFLLTRIGIGIPGEIQFRTCETPRANLAADFLFHKLFHSGPCCIHLSQESPSTDRGCV